MTKQEKETVEQVKKTEQKIEQTGELADEQLEKASGGARPIHKSGDPEDGGN